MPQSKKEMMNNLNQEIQRLKSEIDELKKHGYDTSEVELTMLELRRKINELFDK